MSQAEPGADHGTSLQTRLIRFLEQHAVNSRAALGPDSRVFNAGPFDSLALVELVMWVEAEIGRPIDPDTFDLPKEWATVADIVRFVERHGRSGTRG